MTQGPPNPYTPQGYPQPSPMPPYGGSGGNPYGGGAGPGGGGNTGRTQTPGLLLMILGIISALWHLFMVVLNAIGGGLAALAPATKGRGVENLIGAGVAEVYYVLLVLLALVMAYGGHKMRSLSGYGWAIAGAIISCIPGYCCCVTMPLGIWCLVVLMDSQVKSSFQ